MYGFYLGLSRNKNVNCKLEASPPNPLPDRGGGIDYLCLLRF